MNLSKIKYFYIKSKFFFDIKLSFIRFSFIKIFKTYIFILVSALFLFLVWYFNWIDLINDIDFTNILIAIGTILATIFALVFTLSLLPIQNAAQIWSFSILKIYQRDSQHFRVFFGFGLFTLSCIILSVFEKQIDDFLLFCLIVISISAIFGLLVEYHSYITSLFDPENILNQIKQQAFKTIDYSDSKVKKLAKYHYFLLDKDAKIAIEVLEANVYKELPNYPNDLNYWFRDLAEIYQKSITRNDFGVSNYTLSIMFEILKYFVEKRKNNFLFHSVMAGLLPVKEADIEKEVLEPLYDLLMNLFQISVNRSYESSALEIIEVYAKTSIYLAGVNSKLATKPIQYAEQCIEYSQTANSIEISFQASQILSKVSYSVDDSRLFYEDIDLYIIKSMEQIAIYLYQKNKPELSEHSIGYLMQSNKMDDVFIERLERIMKTVGDCVPFALLSEHIKGKMSGYLPLKEAYSLIGNYSIGNIYQYAVAFCQIDEKREFHNPYQVLIDILDIYWRHLRAIAEQYDIQNSFMIHEIDETIKYIAEINLELYKSPIRDNESDVEALNQKFLWLLSFYWVVYDNKKTFNEYFSRKIIETLKEIAIKYLEQDLIEVGESAIDNIKSVISSVFKISNNMHFVDNLLNEITAIKRFTDKNQKYVGISKKCEEVLNQYGNEKK